MALESGWNDPHLPGAAPIGEGDIIAFVGYGVEFKGVLTYKGNVRIDGHFDGEIRTDDALLIGEQAVVTAQIRAGSIISSGRITGEVTARDSVELKAPAVVNASLHTPKLSMENGVIFNGKISMKQPGGEGSLEDTMSGPAGFSQTKENHERSLFMTPTPNQGTKEKES